VVATDYRPGTTIHVPSGAKARARANIAAITLVRQLEGEDRPATPDEQETLARWSGWGAVPQIFDGREEWTTENVQLRGLLSQQEYRRAEANTLNAHHANDKLGTHWTLHDLRHTAAQRMVDDPRLSLTDVQWVLGHAHLTTTELSLRPREEDVVARVLGHHRRRGEPAAPEHPQRRHARHHRGGEPDRVVGHYGGGEEQQRRAEPDLGRRDRHRGQSARGDESAQYTKATP